MTEAERSASGGGVGSSDFCFRAITAPGQVRARARNNHERAPPPPERKPARPARCTQSQRQEGTTARRRPAHSSKARDPLRKLNPTPPCCPPSNSGCLRLLLTPKRCENNPASTKPKTRLVALLRAPSTSRTNGVSRTKQNSPESTSHYHAAAYATCGGRMPECPRM
jgi:hypothetical protein